MQLLSRPQSCVNRGGHRAEYPPGVCGVGWVGILSPVVSVCDNGGVEGIAWRAMSVHPVKEIVVLTVFVSPTALHPAFVRDRA